MIVEVFVLALASTVRPTSLAAVYALLRHDSRRAFILAYVVAGLAFTVAFGLAVVYAFHGIHVQSGSDETKAIADIVGGVLALLLGVAILTGRVKGQRVEGAPAAGARLNTMLGDRLSMPKAALAGPATHIPGLFYLIALNVIVAHNPEVPNGTFAVLTYNAVWFALPLVALGACIVRPAAARDAIGSVEQWARLRSRTIMLCAAFGVGVALIIRGVLNL